jgi:hypothetical protein
VCEVLTGGLIALLSFGLAVLWDSYKHRRDQRGRQQAGLVGFNEEMLGNHRAAENTLNLLGHERHSRQKQEIKALINPLSQLEHGAWPIARVDLPSELLADYDLMQRLRQVNRNTIEINSLIESRENFRIQHLGGDDPLFEQGFDGYTGVLMVMLRDLKSRIEEATRELRPYLRE